MSDFYDKLNQILIEHISNTPNRQPETIVAEVRSGPCSNDPFNGPSFLRIPISISTDLSNEFRNVDAVIDTGAAATIIIPRKLLNKSDSNIKVSKDSIAIMGVTADKPELHDQVEVYFRFDDHQPIKVTAVISDRIPSILIGNYIFQIADLTVKDGEATLTPKRIIEN